MLSLLYWHLLHSSLSGETSSWYSTLDKRKKNCVREMTVEVGFFSAHPGCYLGNIRAFPYNRYDAISSFLQSMLLAPSVGRWIAAGLLLVIWDSVVCSWFQFLEAWSETTVTTHCPGRNTVCFCVYQNVLISTFIDFVCWPVQLVLVVVICLLKII